MVEDEEEEEEQLEEEWAMEERKVPAQRARGGGTASARCRLRRKLFPPSQENSNCRRRGLVTVTEGKG